MENTQNGSEQDDGQHVPSNTRQSPSITIVRPRNTSSLVLGAQPTSAVPPPFPTTESPDDPGTAALEKGKQFIHFQEDVLVPPSKNNPRASRTSGARPSRNPEQKNAKMSTTEGEPSTKQAEGDPGNLHLPVPRSFPGVTTDTTPRAPPSPLTRTHRLSLGRLGTGIEGNGPIDSRETPITTSALTVLYESATYRTSLTPIDIVAVHRPGENPTVAWADGDSKLAKNVNKRHVKKEKGKPTTAVEVWLGTWDEKQPLPEDALPPSPPVEVLEKHLKDQAEKLEGTSLAAGDQISQDLARALQEKDQNCDEQETRSARTEKPRGYRDSPLESRQLYMGSNVPGALSKYSEDSLVPSTTWLSDPFMIPNDFPDCRVLGFQYPRKSRGDGIKNAVEKAGVELLTCLDNHRTESQRDTPVIFIGYGVGALIIQGAFNLQGTNNTQPIAIHQPTFPGTFGICPKMDFPSAFLFLDPPPPLESPNESSNDDRSGGLPEPNPGALEYRSRLLGWDRTELAAVTTKVWETFRNKIWSRKRLRFPMWWMFLEGAAKKKGYRSFCVPVSRATHNCQSLSRFPRPDASAYNLVRDRMKSLLMLLAASHPSMIRYMSLHAYPSAPFPLGTCDHEQRSLLHLAAEIPGPDTVEYILQHDPKAISVLDRTRQTPLHAVVACACRQNPETEEEKAPFRQVAVKLMTTGVDWARKDIKCRTALMLTKGARVDLPWLREILEPPSIEYGPQRVDMPECVDEPERPQYRERTLICREVKTELHEFYIFVSPTKRQNHEGKWEDFLKHSEGRNWVPGVSIYDLIYDKGPWHVLNERRESSLKQGPKVSWIHIPSNNEQWIKDLFLRLGIHDLSLEGMRHQGRTICSRFIYPHAVRYSQGHANPLLNDKAKSIGFSSHVSAHSGLKEKAAVALFMPFLTFETHGNRKKMTGAIRSSPKDPFAKRDRIYWENFRDPERGIIHSYLENKDGPLHPRRTLDQFYHHLLDNTRRRDRDQVLSKWAWKETDIRKADDVPVVMVDQLWLWVVDDDVVVTSFPNSWESAFEHGFPKLLADRIKDKSRVKLISSPHQLTALILNLAVDFLRREGPGKQSFLGCFESIVSNAADKEATLFRQFQKVARTLSQAKISKDDSRQATLELFKVKEETASLAKIKDVLDETNMALTVMRQQREVIATFSAAVPADWGQKPRSRDAAVDAQGLEERRGKLASERPHEQDPDPDPESWTQFVSTPGAVLPQLAPNIFSASKDPQAGLPETMRIISEGINTLENLYKYARRVEEDLKQLLDFKQKQANAWEARLSRERYEEVERQGNTLLVFTIVTIIFAPLSFMSSFFAIQIASFPHDPDTGEVSWPIRSVALYLFLISLGVVIVLVFIAVKINEVRAFFGNVFGRWLKGTRKGTAVGGQTKSYEESNFTASSTASKGGDGSEKYEDGSDAEASYTIPMHSRKPRFGHNGWGFKAAWNTLRLLVPVETWMMKRIRHRPPPPPRLSSDLWDTYTQTSHNTTIALSGWTRSTIPGSPGSLGNDEVVEECDKGDSIISTTGSVQQRHSAPAGDSVSALGFSSGSGSSAYRPGGGTRQRRPVLAENDDADDADHDEVAESGSQEQAPAQQVQSRVQAYGSPTDVDLEGQQAGRGIRSAAKGKKPRWWRFQ
ncbi:hypothetical protein MKZ38_006689 [Zalerion maritima]|uniref:Ankyrin repeat protein n=1 Tax=Zalerion maritima TaxID=339359 RepID=A0AAD5RIZ2_9PEZI|nr:hypothetical protein MKZ38_006689 [Zalerion maritima]